MLLLSHHFTNEEIREQVVWSRFLGREHWRPSATPPTEATCTPSPPCVCAQLLSHVRLSVAPWTVARQAPLSMGFSSKNTGVGCHFLLQGSSRPRDQTQVSHVAGGLFTTEPPGRPPPAPHHFHVLRVPAADRWLSLSGVGWGVERTWAPPGSGGGAPSPGLRSLLPPHLLLLRTELQSRGPSGLHKAGAGTFPEAQQGSRNVCEREPSLLPRALGRTGPGEEWEPAWATLELSPGLQAAPRPECSCSGPTPPGRLKGCSPQPSCPRHPSGLFFQ